MTQERGILCMFCGEGFGYAGDKPDDETMKAAVNHEKDCPKNPYTYRIKMLEDLIREADPLRWSMSCHDIVVNEARAWYKKAAEAVKA